MRSPEVTRPERPVRVLVTGAGGPAAYGFLRLALRPDVEMCAADMDPVASGLFLVPRERRVTVPPGDHPDFVDEVRRHCRRLGVTILVPTVDCELLPLSRVRDLLAADGVQLLASPTGALEACLDKAQLARVCGRVGTPRTEVLLPHTPVPQLPAVVKPRRGSGSRGVRVVHRLADLRGVPRDGTHLLQEHLPGEELSVDVFVRADGAVVAAVPRTRDRVDSGVAVAGRTVADAQAAAVAAGFAVRTGLRGVANVQLRRRADGSPTLLEINPRLPGSLVLTAAAGANLAALLLAEALGEPVPDHVPFREVALVRHLSEVVVDLDEYTVPTAQEVVA